MRYLEYKESFSGSFFFFFCLLEGIGKACDIESYNVNYSLNVV